MAVFIFSDGRVSFPVVLGQVDVAVLRPRGEQTKDQRQKRHPDLLLGSQLVSFLLFLKVVSHNFEFNHSDCGSLAMEGPSVKHQDKVSPVFPVLKVVPVDLE